MVVESAAGDWSPVAGRPGRVALVQPWWRFWQHAAPPGHTEAMAEAMVRLSAQLEAAELADRHARPGRSPVTFESLGLWDVEALEPAQVARLDGADAVVVLITMAAPPQAIQAVLERFPRLPVVLCALDDTAALSASFSHHDITSRGATVGLPMMASALSRAGRTHEIAVATLDDPSSVRDLARRCVHASHAGRIAGARLGRVGLPQDGYVHVDAPDAAFAEGFGVDVVRLRPEDFLEHYRRVTEDAVELGLVGLTDWDVEPDADRDLLRRTVRSEVALSALVREHRLDAGAFNCHVPQIRFGTEIGITPCFALGSSTTRGVPWTCTGDVLTAIAMLIAKVVSGSALYHELEAMDHTTGELVIANTGEHDLTLTCGSRKPRLRKNVWYRDSDARCGYCAVAEIEPGPMTLIATVLDPQGQMRVVTAEGAVTDRAFPRTGTMNGAFRFATGPPKAAWIAWATTGVGHHSAVAKGHQGDAVAAMCRHLGLRHTAI